MDQHAERALREEVVTSTVTDKRVGIWDGWRGIAILMVLCGHFIDIKWLWEDRMGVDIFFALSGMLMSIILYEKRQSLKDFYIRRLSRIFPALLAYVVTVFSIAVALALPFTDTEFFSSLLFLRTYLPSDPHIWTSPVSIGHLWSLNVEEHAYLILSFLTLILINRRHIAFLLITLTILSIALSLYQFATLSSDAFTLYLIRTESSIVFIFISAAYTLLYRQAGWSTHPLLPVACFALAVLCYAQAAPLWLIITACPLLLAVTINHLDQLPSLFKSLLLFAPLRYIGLWSYSIYLWQQLFYEYSWKIPGGASSALILSVLVGAASFYFLENPIRHRINRRWSAQPRYRSCAEGNPC